MIVSPDVGEIKLKEPEITEKTVENKNEVDETIIENKENGEKPNTEISEINPVSQPEQTNTNQGDDYIDNSITIYFYLRYNAISCSLCLTLDRVENFPGPDKGGFLFLRVFTMLNRLIFLQFPPRIHVLKRDGKLSIKRDLNMLSLFIIFNLI